MKLYTEKWENNIEILNINHNYNNPKIWLQFQNLIGEKLNRII